MTLLARELNIDFPICNAGMAFVAGPELAAAVTSQGGLGFIGAGVLPAVLVEQLIQKTKLRLKEKPFGIDFITPFFQQEHLDLVLQHKPKVVVFFHGIPEVKILKEIQKIGSKVWVTVNSVEDANRAVNLTPDALIIQGVEAGGHVQAVLTAEELFSAIHHRYPEIPKLWAGGTATGKDVRRALDAGASGVWCGTVFLASNEANAHKDYKETVIKATSDETTITKAFGPEWPDEPMRVFLNTAAKAAKNEIVHPETNCIGESYIGGQAVPMPKYSCILPMKDTIGDTDLMALTMGEVSAQISAVRSVELIMDELKSGILDLNN
jgi:enoyl-[acyl-carrier protein] reductase II